MSAYCCAWTVSNVVDGCNFIGIKHGRNGLSETLVHQRAIFHQLHHPNPSQQHQKGFSCLHGVTQSTYKIIAMCSEYATVLWDNNMCNTPGWCPDPPLGINMKLNSMSNLGCNHGSFIR